MFIRSQSTKQSFSIALKSANINEEHKLIIQERYGNVVRNFEIRCFYLSILFHSARFIVTVGSLIVPALLSIQYVDAGPSSNVTDPGTFAYRIYWTTWVISLFVSICNGVLSVFKIEKKYYFLHTTLEQLKSEGWQYLQLSGHYSGFHTPNEDPSHQNQFTFFCHYVEKIKMKQVEEEYYKLLDKHTTESSQKQSNTDSGIKKDTIIPITPLRPLVEQAKALPPELLDQIIQMAKTEPINSKENIEKDEKK
jgi:hypothetical protein